MKKVVPFLTLDGAKRQLDNGGGFFSFLSRTGDSLVTWSELQHAAGPGEEDVEVFVFLDMALHDLSPQDQGQVLGLLDPEVRERFETGRPAHISPGEFDTEAGANRAVVVTGHASTPDADEAPGGFVAVPTTKDETARFVAVCDVFDVYFVYARRDRTSAPCMVLHPKDADRITLAKARFGGVARPICTSEDGTGEVGLCLYPTHYTPLG